MKKRLLSVVTSGCLVIGAFLMMPGYDSMPPQLPEGRAGDEVIAADVSKPASASSVVVADNYGTGRTASGPAQGSQKLNGVPKSTASPKAKLRSDTVVIDNKQYPRTQYTPAAIPNDPLASQWWVDNTHADQAWDTPRGARETLLAVIDTGFALQHEDLASQWEHNDGEMGTTAQEGSSRLNCTDRSLPLDASCNLVDDDGNGIVDDEAGALGYENPSQLNCSDQGRPLDKSCNRLDDDGNGYPDDVTGWDFINYDNSVQAGEINPNGVSTAHGTEVAALAAAASNNSAGIAGVDSGTKVLPLQAIDDDEYGDTVSVGRSILYAVSRGADVISLSLGGVAPDAYIRDAISQAIASGAVVVAASGNDGCDCMLYPANYPEVVAVGAVNAAGAPAAFSSWGANLDILAPGVNMTSATWVNGNAITAYASGINGTSFATPLVSGLMTRILSQQPAAAPLQLIAAVTENTDRLSLSATASRSNSLGFGSLDMYKATQRMTVPQQAQMLYGLTPVSIGRTLGAYEVPAAYVTHTCAQGTAGTTPVYELTRPGGHLFTNSEEERYRSAQLGYTSRFFTYSCLQQPHDRPIAVRNLNIFREFRNIGYKP